MSERLTLLNTLAAEPSATVRKFKLMKAFVSLLPPDAKTMSAAEIEAWLRERITKEDPQ